MARHSAWAWVSGGVRGPRQQPPRGALGHGVGGQREAAGHLAQDDAPVALGVVLAQARQRLEHLALGRLAGVGQPLQRHRLRATGTAAPRRLCASSFMPASAPHGDRAEAARPVPARPRPTCSSSSSANRVTASVRRSAPWTASSKEKRRAAQQRRARAPGAARATRAARATWPRSILGGIRSRPPTRLGQQVGLVERPRPARPTRAAGAAGSGAER